MSAGGLAEQPHDDLMRRSTEMDATLPASNDTKLPLPVLGEQLHVGSVVLDATGGGHRIDHFKPYPGRFGGDVARRAYEHEDEHGWCATVCDHERFRVSES